MGNACVKPVHTTTAELLGKRKYILDVGAVMCQFDDRKPVQGALVVFGTKAPQPPGLCFTFRDTKSGTLYLRELSDDELAAEKDSAQITHGWAPFFKSIAADVAKGKAQVTQSGSSAVQFSVVIVSTKDANSSQPFTISLKGRSNPSTKDVNAYLLGPMTRMVQAKRNAATDNEKELRLGKFECDVIVKEASQRKHQGIVDTLQPSMNSLRENADRDGKASTQLSNTVQQIERRLRKLKRPKDRKHPMDSLYEEGGARPFQHIPEAEEHEPVDKPYSSELCEFIRKHFPKKEGQPFADYLTGLTKNPSNPEVAKLKAVNENIDVSLFSRLDFWDYNVFRVEESTGGNALFYTTYALLHKLNLSTHFKIDDAVLRRFLVAVQAGYHPNPYHNATHAADVAQINYFIIMRCGLNTVCSLSQEEILASVIAGAIHDYNHPGLNNSFHYNTSAYLSTLYNDRSILENHHLACVYEILQLPKYNIFAKLTEDQTRLIRDVITEMVLSTDMGLHGKILSQFQRRIQEGAQWTKREDAFLALSMSIKMADIANCGRPTELYIAWAKNIAAEFYNQGDVEKKKKLPISPFMDRRKDRVDFPKGQASFINFVVMPTFEAMGELLPDLHFTYAHCTENREYWQKRGAS